MRAEFFTMCGFRLANDAAAARESSEKQSFRLRDELDLIVIRTCPNITTQADNCNPNLSVGLIATKNGKSYLLDTFSPN